MALNQIRTTKTTAAAAKHRICSMANYTFLSSKESEERRQEKRRF